MTRRWQYAKAMYDAAIEKHRKRSGYQFVMAQEVLKSLRRLPRKRGKAA